MDLSHGLLVTVHPEADGKYFLENRNPDSLTAVTAYVDPPLASVQANQSLQRERHVYFVTDLVEHSVNKTVFNRVTAMGNS